MYKKVEILLYLCAGYIYLIELKVKQKKKRKRNTKNKIIYDHKRVKGHKMSTPQGHINVFLIYITIFCFFLKCNLYDRVFF